MHLYEKKMPGKPGTCSIFTSHVSGNPAQKDNIKAPQKERKTCCPRTRHHRNLQGHTGGVQTNHIIVLTGW